MNNIGDNKSNRFHWPILGHGSVKEYLQQSINNNKLSHAYLFYGPNNVGKSLITQYLTSSLLCSTTSDRLPCGVCSSCLQIEKNIHPDIVIISRDKEKNNISIQQIRDVQHKLSLKSFLTSFKIAIINEADSMTEEAANALLKTLEEPTPKTIFVLTTNKKENLPETIVSRCLPLSFNLIPEFQIENWLITQGKSRHDARIISNLSIGRPGLAKKMLLNPSLIMKKNHRIDELLSIIKSDFSNKFSIVKKMIDDQSLENDSNSLKNILEDWFIFFRDVLLIKSGFHEITLVHFKEKIIKISLKFAHKQLFIIMNDLIKSLKLLKNSVNSRLVFENIILNF